MSEPYYSDELVTLYHGDCREVTEWLTADVLVTDPPYGVAYVSGQMSRAAVPIVSAIAGDEDAAVRDAVLAAWGDRAAIVFGSWKVERPRGVRHLLVWHKATRMPGFSTAPYFGAHEEVYVLGSGHAGKPHPSVITTHETRDGAQGEVAKIGHPTPKPLDLMAVLIERCPPGTVADPFAGSGSTLVAAKRLGRKAIGVELDERYCEIAAKRLAQGVLNFAPSP